MLDLLLVLLFPPLLPGIVNRVKAGIAGRSGPPLLQTYFDIAKLLRKGAVYSRTTTWVFPAGPILSLAAVISAGILLPLGSGTAPFGFPGDVILFAYLLGLARFVTMAAALDTGSSFEGMGASREAAFSALAEPALFLALAIFCVTARSASFTEIWSTLPALTGGWSHPALFAAAAALFAVLLAENSRIPVDDPATHLELTMVHEVMVLDHGGPDLAFIVYGSAIKLFLFAALLSRLVLPIGPQGAWADAALFVAGEIGVAILVGLTESFMARLRLPRVPQFLIGAGALAAIGLVLLFYRGLP